MPITSVVESGEYIVSRGQRSEDPKRHENGDESENMEYQDDTVDGGQVLGEYSVDEEGKKYQNNGYKASMPSLRNVIGMIEHDYALNLCPG